MKLNHKYVLHIPLYKHENGKVVRIDIEKHLQELFTRLKNKYISFYVQDVKGYYKNNWDFDEKIIVLFTQTEDEALINIFRMWFNENNPDLKQESFAYEHNNELITEKL